MQEGTESNSTEPKRTLGINKDVRSTTEIPFEVTKDHHFNKCALVEVVYKSTEIKNGTDKGKFVPTLNFTFQSGDRTKKHTETFFEVKETKNKTFEEMYEWFSAKVKHLYETFAPFTEEVQNNISGAADFTELFTKIANQFNTGGKDGIPVFKDEAGKYIACWIKLTYNTQGRLQMPLFPNFIEKIRGTVNEEKPLTLTIGTKDVIVRPETTAPNVVDGVPGAGTKKAPEGFDF